MRPCGETLVRGLCCLAVLAAAAAIGACGSDDDGGNGSPGPGGSQPIGHRMKQTIPAQIDKTPDSFVSSELLRPVVNAWRTSNHRQFTEVDAGALATDDSTGAFTIFRHEFERALQDVDVVKVKGSGPLRITTAPLGRKGESAQQRGKLDFVSANGVRGTLRLKNDTVRLRKP